jgi:hypothetical protein
MKATSKYTTVRKCLIRLDKASEYLGAEDFCVKGKYFFLDKKLVFEIINI